MSLTILFTMVFGPINVGIALYSYNFDAESAREGSRYAMVRGSSCTSPCTAATNASVQTYVQSLRYPGLNSSNVTVTTTWPDTGSSCTPSIRPATTPETTSWSKYLTLLHGAFRSSHQALSRCRAPQKSPSRNEFISHDVWQHCPVRTCCEGSVSIDITNCEARISFVLLWEDPAHRALMASITLRSRQRARDATERSSDIGPARFTLGLSRSAAATASICSWSQALCPAKRPEYEAES